MPISEATRTKALDALEGMRSIVRREMLVQDSYVEDEVSNPRLTKAICGGRKHCAIGSLWAGAGIKLEKDGWGGVDLPGVQQSDRDDFIKHRPRLRLALEALNAEATAFAKAHSLSIDSTWADPIEGLFESHYGRKLTKRDLLTIIAAAKRRIKAQP